MTARYVCTQCGELAGRRGTCPRDGHELAATEDALLGAEVGRYRLIRLIGKGGMGRVYEAVQPALGSRVAIKVLAEDAADRPDLVDRFFTEARTVAMIRHEGIVNVLDLAWLPGGRPAIVMELVTGHTLGALVRGRPAPIGGAVQVMIEVLSALAAAHAIGIVHRDLKPDNILITSIGRAKVLDFGIAKLAADRHGPLPHTRTGAVLGTPQYMSPEQIGGATLDARSDLYSAGVVLFEAVTGRRPFEGLSDFALMRAHVEVPPPPPRALRPELPVELEHAILRALAKQRGERFASANEMANALHAATARLPPGECRALPPDGRLLPRSPTPPAPPPAVSLITAPLPAPFEHAGSASPGQPPPPPAPGRELGPPPGPRTAQPPDAAGGSAEPGVPVPRPSGARDVAAPARRRRWRALLPVAAAALGGSLATAWLSSRPGAPLAVAPVHEPPAHESPAHEPPAHEPPAHEPPAASGESGAAMATPGEPTPTETARAGAPRSGPSGAAGGGSSVPGGDAQVAAASGGAVRHPARTANDLEAHFTVPLGIDPGSFDPVGFFPTALGLARRLEPDAHLTEIEFAPVASDGHVVFGDPSTHRFEYAFYSRARASDPVTEVRRNDDGRVLRLRACALQVAITDDGSAVAVSRWASETCADDEERPPRCRFADVWAKARAAGFRVSEPAWLHWHGEVWEFHGTRDEGRELVRYTDDCGRGPRKPPVDTPASATFPDSFSVENHISDRQFDPLGYIPTARALARRLDDDAELTGLTFQPVTSDGHLVFDGGGGHVYTYAFVSPSRAAQQPDASGRRKCVVTVEIVADGTALIRRESAEVCDRVVGPSPRCTLAQVWARALAAAVDRSEPARLEWSGADWRFKGVKAGNTITLDFPDNCH
ncbi:MAG TPA: protein kinase [Kofleriaceae bacterium]|nr:protein kinase [Kofleriaceae bacterium]